MPVITGIGSYQANPDGRKVAARQLEEEENRRKLQKSSSKTQGISSSASTGKTGSSIFSRRGGGAAASSSSSSGSGIPFSNDHTNPYASSSTSTTPYGGTTSEDSQLDTEGYDTENGADSSATGGYTPFDYQDQPDADKVDDLLLLQSHGISAPQQRFNDIRAKVSAAVMSKRNPLKFTPSTTIGPAVVRGNNKFVGSAVTGEPVDALKPFSTNIDNDFDYDSFIEDQEKEDAAEELAEAREIELSNRRHLVDEDVRQKFARKHLDYLA